MRWDYDEYKPTLTLGKSLEHCSKWLQARKKRKNAKPAKISIDLSYDLFVDAYFTDSSDEIISTLFNASLSNKRIVCLWHWQDTISVVVRDSEDKSQTNIDPTVMETILSWFKNEEQKNGK